MSNLMYHSKRFIKKNSSTILTVLGAVGVVATSVTTAKATLKASEVLKKAEEEKGEKLETSETIKIVAPIYILPFAIGASTIGCIFGANILNKRQQAAITSAYALIDSSYKKYKDKVKELYGEETHNNVIDSIVKEKSKDVAVYAPGFSEVSSQHLEDESEPRLFYDKCSERYFEASIEKVLIAEYHLNRNFTSRGCVSLNEFYEFLGLDIVDYGDTIGWSINDDGLYWIDFNHRKVMLDDTLECYVIETPYEPSIEYLDY